MSLARVFLVGLTCCRNPYPPASPSPVGPDLLSFSRIEHAQRLADGHGVVVAVIDWQFDLSGQAGRKYIDPVSMVPDEPIGSLQPWHGEWMAEIVHRVAPKAMIIPIKARGLGSGAYEDYLVQGLSYAADHGAVAVCSSMGPLRQTDALRASIDHAESHGMVFVDVHPEYLPGEDGELRNCSVGECDLRIVHTGIVSVPAHVVSPEASRDIYTWPYDLIVRYKDGWGFSNAPPTVVGVIALMRSVAPGLGPADIRRILVQTAESIDGFRVLDALAAVEASRAAGG